MSKIAEVAAAVENGKLKLIEGLVNEALDSGCDPLAILNEGMIGAMGIVGAKFQKSEIFVPEMLVAAKTMKKGVEILKPRLASGATTKLGKCIIGTVHGDLHDIGKNLVSLMIESAGFEVIDLGVDVLIDTFIAKIKENPDTKIVALSALLTTTMPSLGDTAKAIKASGLTGFKLIVGGAPVTQDFAAEIGADGYADDAAGAATLAAKLAG
ncbi:cobalamin-binding protein [Spirochaetia bacterium]|nr:cobalamin-binding protein [Spirochaetia bacterium]